MLRLSIENVPSLPSGDPVEVELNEHGLVIGRAAHADWTLPDPSNFVSSVHCEIDYREGRYYLTDRSTNGSFINGSGQRLTKPTQLRDGDLVQIGHYQIRVEETGSAAASADPFGAAAPAAPSFGGINWGGGEPAVQPINPEKFGREPPKPIFQSSSDPLMGAFAAPSANPFGLGGASPPPAPPTAPAANPFGLGAPSTQPPAPPPPATPAANPFGLGAGPVATPAPPAADPFGVASAPPPAANPFGVSAPAAPSPDPFGMAAPPPAAPASAPPASDPWASLNSFGAIDFSSAAPTPAPSPAPTPEPAPAAATPPPAPASAPAETRLFDRLLAAAGLKRADMGDTPPETVVETAGQLLRQTADGLIRLLDARTRVRHQFGVGANVTTFQRAGNNPLKWTRSPEHALKQMVGAPEPGFLGGAQAVQGAFEDLQAHEMAMIAAMQEAIHATISRFAPETIQQRIGARGWLKSVLPGSREATLWRAYESEFRAFADESEAAYLDLFAKQFKKAYENNVAKSDSR